MVAMYEIEDCLNFFALKAKAVKNELPMNFHFDLSRIILLTYSYC